MHVLDAMEFSPGISDAWPLMSHTRNNFSADWFKL